MAFFSKLLSHAVNATRGTPGFSPGQTNGQNTDLIGGFLICNDLALVSGILDALPPLFPANDSQ
jgi:hypothetical protein